MAAEPEPTARRAQAKKAFDAGNFKDAYEAYRTLALDAKDDPKLVGTDLQQAVYALQRLGRSDETDAFREKVVELHAKNWRLLYAAAQSLFNGEHYGFIVGGEFSRGNKRGGGQYVNSYPRDRARGLQLMDQALPLTKNEDDHAAVSEFCLTYSRNLLFGGGYHQAWRLQYLTDFKKLPDYEEGWYQGGTQGAPVSAKNAPEFAHLAPPLSYEMAQSDGQRWRWLLDQAAELDANRQQEARTQFAELLHQQFGVQTMAQYSHLLRQAEDAADKEGKPGKQTGTFQLHTLGEDETIARLATGVQRFKLPDEFNFIRVYKEIADAGKSTWGENALNTLAQIFSDRRQYPKSADYWRRSIKEYGPGNDNYKQKALDQIVKNWGQFDPIEIQPAGTKATLEYVFRNGKHVDFEAHAIKIPEILEDLKAYLKKSPNQIDWNQINIGNIGYRLVTENQTKYIGEKVATFALDLEPRPEHFDKRVTVQTPLDKPGAYLITAKLTDGNVSRIIVWLNNTAIAKKILADQTWYFIADAVTGAPVAKANVEFFGWQQTHVGNNQFKVTTSSFAEFSGPQGEVLPKPKDLQQNFQWLAIARAEGRFAFHGFSNVWYGNRRDQYDQQYNQNKVLVITDRPVYRPDQPVKFKLWVRKARYDQADKSDFAHRSFNVQINTQQGEQVFKKTFTTDAYGGIEGEYALPKGAMLGAYGIYIVDSPEVGGGGSFRVEEYKKPEFEVTVEAPKEPVMLGEKITATVQAKYFFGAPVVNAKVKYKILRNAHDERWYPVAAWDWFYGRGYWWFAYDYPWYPGWNRWGCKRPLGWWWPAQHNPPEVVAEAEVPIGPDGKIEITIDTALTKEVHGNEDHKYSLTAEVTDESRRTIVGSGDVLVARQPFKVFTWVDRGFYRTGDVIHAHAAAHTLSQQPVIGKAELVLYQITYDDKQQPVEKAVEEWALETTAEGYLEQQIKAAQPGQYRLSCKVTDAKAHTIEGAYIFVVRGEGFDGEKFRFDNLELITDKKEYAPGETVKLMINTARANGTVALFLRPANGVYLRPKIFQLDGKSHVEEVAVVTKDMPNFFVEALTISGGELYSQLKEVAVPPAKRVLNVTVEPSAQQYKPGELAKVQLKLTDADGKPFQGSTVMTVYDKSIEYISGGSNVPEIKEFFWKWRRHHYPQTEHNLSQTFYNLLKQGEIGMSFLGVFGQSVADEMRNKDGAKGEGAAFGAQNRREAAMTLAAPGAPRAAMAKSMNGAARELQASDAVASDKQQSDRDASAEGGNPPEMVQPTVRKNFADTAFWAGTLSTDKEGRAEIEFKMPEQLTGWKIKTWAMGHGTKVGQASVDVVTAKNLLVRMQAPRFFVETDEVVLSANVHNYLKTDKTVEVTLQLDGKQLETITDATQKVLVKAGGEERVDWRVKVVTEGEAVVRMQGLTDEESDAMEMKFPVYVHGLLKTESFAGVLRPKEDAGKLTFKVPAERRKEQSRLEVRYSPTLAGALVDALPYLVDSPLENTECTLNRFLPTVITQNILLRMKLDLKAIQQKRTNLNAQEIGNDQERAKQWKRFDRNPVFDAEEVQQLVKEGVKSLTAMQLSDGGWGWFSGYGEHSWPHTTALVVHGLQIATQNEVALVPGTLEKGVDWLKRYQADQVQRLKNAPAKTNPWKQYADNLDALIYMVLADADVADADMREFLYRDRTKLAVYGLGLYGLALHKQGQKEKLAMIMENISQYVVEDAENQTAYLKLPNDNYWWYWYGSDVEANAFYLKLLAKTDPQSPRAAGLVKYLLNNRKHATYWNSTRDTAFAIEALAEYLVASGEIAPDLTVEVWLDGKKQKEVQVNGDNLFSYDNQFVLIAEGVETGEHTLEFKKKGKGPLYWNTYLTYFSLEDFITKAGLEIKVERTFYKLNRVDKEVKVAGARGQALDQKVEKYEREKLENLSTLKSGDLVEIELVMESKNDYEYLMFEDLKASGFEPVEVRSGYSGNGLGAYMQLRDERVQFFLRTIARGKHSLSYKLRAEIPGKFSALPATGSAVYAPELKANSDEFKVLIQD